VGEKERKREVIFPTLVHAFKPACILAQPIGIVCDRSKVITCVSSRLRCNVQVHNHIYTSKFAEESFVSKNPSCFFSFAVPLSNEYRLPTTGRNYVEHALAC